MAVVVVKRSADTYMQAAARPELDELPAFAADLGVDLSPGGDEGLEMDLVSIAASARIGGAATPAANLAGGEAAEIDVEAIVTAREISAPQIIVFREWCSQDPAVEANGEESGRNGSRQCIFRGGMDRAQMQ